MACARGWRHTSSTARNGPAFTAGMKFSRANVPTYVLVAEIVTLLQVRRDMQTVVDMR